MKIAVLHDLVKPGAAPDLQDNLAQAGYASLLLKKLGHQVFRTPFCETGFQGKSVSTNILFNQKPDLVFNLVEAPKDQGRLIHMAPLLLERLGLCYTGSGVKALMSTSNKLWAKRILRSAGLLTPDWLHPTMDGAGGGVQAGAFILKSVWEHGSFGLDNDSAMDHPGLGEVKNQMRLRADKYGGDWFAERFIFGREFNLSLLASETGAQVLPPAEMLFTGYSDHEYQLVDYAAKWEPQNPHFDGTRRRFDFGMADSNLLQQLKHYARQCWKLFGLRGWARVDFRIDEEGSPWILEVNANPCLAKDAGFMAAVKRAGLKPEQAVDFIIKDAFSARREKADNQRSLFHAGENERQNAVMA